MHTRLFVCCLCVIPVAIGAQGTRTPPRENTATTVLRPARVFDGETMHEGWAVRVRGERIDAAGPAATVTDPAATIVDLPGTTLMPGLI
jgi:imidazolonepropionase-like amidohydrolase